MSDRTHSLRRTPALESLLQGLRRRLLVQVWLHGLGTIAAVTAIWLLFAFLADWVLRVPAPLRILHGLVLFGAAGFFLWRGLLRPLGRIPGPWGLAILVERAHPELGELLVSAAQLQETACGDGARDDAAPDLVELVLAEADRRAGGMTAQGVLDERTPRSRFLLGAMATAFLSCLSTFNPTYSAIFLDRMFGGSTPWPQRTHLQVEIPLHDERARVDETPERIRVRVARGTHVPVLVRAEGLVPDDVTMHFSGGRDLLLSPSGGGVFRTLLPCDEDLSFHVTGGDDRDGLPEVEIQVLQPPDVEGIAIHVRPPRYCDLPEVTVFDRDVEVVAGSLVRVHVLQTPRDARGAARILPDDRTIELVAAPFPPRPDAEGGSDGGEEATVERGLAFELVVEKSIGYRFELVDSTGLANPEPGLFRIHVTDDRPPEVRLLAPGRSDYETVIGAAIPVRAVAEDDFGLESMGWTVTPARPGDVDLLEPPALAGTFEPRPVPHSTEEGRSRPGSTLLANARIEVDDLAPEGGELGLDQRFVLVVTARDNHRPKPGEGRSLPVRIRLVSADELLRRMQDRLARARLDAGRLAELQREKRRRVEELLDSIEGDSPLETGDDLALESAGVGQRRVQANAHSLARDLANVAEDILYSRLDDKSAGLLEFLDARLATIDDELFHAGPWRELGRAQGEGALGAPGFSGNLVALVDLALEVSEDLAQQASEAVGRAQKATEAADTRDALVEAVELQTRSLERIEDLLERLAEWDNFQNVLALTRDILSRQKALRDRTRRFAKEKR